MSNFQKIALFYVLILVVFFYGYATARFKIPPYTNLESVVQEILAFNEGGALDEETTVVEKLLSDAGSLPKRFIGGYPETADLHHVPMTMPGVKSRRNQPQI